MLSPDSPPWLLILHVVLLLLAAVALVATLLPLLRRTAWWIRVCDFPRLQIMAGALLTLGGGLWLRWYALAGAWGWALLAALGAVVVYQLVRVLPYTPVANKQVEDSALPAGEGQHLSLAVMNVLQYNRQGQQALEVLRAADADVILAVETDDWWLAQLRPLEATHPYTCYEPRDNTYGLLFFSRLPLRGCTIKCLIDDDVPSLHTAVQLPGAGGPWVRLYGLHPKPPAPAEAKTSTRRDAELLLVGQEIEQHQEPSIVFGDMNDVAWSHTSELFRRISGLLDPRVGRGLLATFHADHRLLRWPLDHVFVSPEFKVDGMQRLPYVGSDHFPIFIKLSYEPQDKAGQAENCEQADADDHQEANEKIAEGHAEEVEEESEEAAGRKPEKELTT